MNALVFQILYLGVPHQFQSILVYCMAYPLIDRCPVPVRTILKGRWQPAFRIARASDSKMLQINHNKEKQVSEF
jgi:hypothetical protein